MFEDAPCEKCGHKRKPYLMSTNPDAPSFKEMWNGEGKDPLLNFLAKYGTLALVFLFVLGALVLLHVGISI